MARRVREITAPCNFPQRTTTADIVGDHHAGAPTMPRPGATGLKLIRSALGHDGRGGLALADADAASNAYRNESRDQSDEYFFHWNSPLFHATRCTLRASLHRWSPAEANGSPAPETVGHFKGDCVLGDTVTRRAQQNLPESGSRFGPPAPTTPRLFQG